MTDVSEMRVVELGSKGTYGASLHIRCFRREDAEVLVEGYNEAQRAIGLSRVYDHIGNPDPDKPGQSTEVAIIQWIERTMAEWKREQVAAIDLRAQLATAKTDLAKGTPTEDPTGA